MWTEPFEVCTSHWGHRKEHEGLLVSSPDVGQKGGRGAVGLESCQQTDMKRRFKGFIKDLTN